jgi:hypothetical protein
MRRTFAVGLALLLPSVAAQGQTGSAHVAWLGWLGDHPEAVIPLIAFVGAAVVLQWRRITHRQIGEALKHLRFSRHGLREYVERIARGEGTDHDRDQLRELLRPEASSEIYTVGFNLYQRQEQIETSHGLQAAGLLDDVVDFAKHRIRQAIPNLSAMDPKSPDAVRLAQEISSGIEKYNAKVEKLHDLLVPSGKRAPRSEP